jgi:hypothetical protein
MIHSLCLSYVREKHGAEMLLLQINNRRLDCDNNHLLTADFLAAHNVV